MKFELNWPSDFLGNYVLMCRWDPNTSDLAEKLKVNLDL